MKKVYEFKVEVDSFVAKGKFMEELMNEVNEEKKQLELTHKINLESNKIYRKIFEDLIKEIENELSTIDLRFEDIYIGICTNKIEPLYSRIRIGRNIIFLHLNPQSTKVEDTKYTTFIGDYDLSYRIEYLHNDSHTINKENPIEDFLNKNKSKIKEYLTQN